MHTYAHVHVYVCSTGIITGINHILCRAGSFCLNHTRAPVVAWMWALCFGGCAAAVVVGSMGAPRPNNVSCSQKTFCQSSPAPQFASLWDHCYHLQMVSPAGLWSEVSHLAGTKDKFFQWLRLLWKFICSSPPPSTPIILFKWRKQKNVKSAKKIIGKWCSWTSSC